MITGDARAAVAVFAAVIIATTISPLAAQDTGRLQTARLHFQKGRYAEALEAYDEVPPSAENAVAVPLGKSRVLAAQGELEKAAALVERAAKAHPRDPRLSAELAALRLRTGDYQEAEKLAKTALELDDRQPLARLVLADAFTETGRIEQANEGYRWFVRYYNRAQPEEAETLLLVARGAVRYARWNGVSQIFDFVVNTLCPDALADDEQSWRAYFISGRLLLEKYNRAQAIPELKRALAINPRATPVLVALGEAAFQEFELEEAADYAERALKVNPRDVSALNLKADVELAQGDVPAALRTIAKALAVNPNDQRTLARRATCFLLLDGVPEEFNRLLANLDAVEGLAIESPDRFTRLVIDLAKRNPRPGYFLTQLGTSLESRRRYYIAEKLYRRAIDLMPQLSEPKTSLGMLYMRIGKTEEAETILDEAFQADPYHVRVSNMRKVLRLLNGYETITTDHFVIRVDSQIDKVLGQYMAEYLEEVYGDLVEQYGYEPPHRTHFEIYNNAKGLSAHQWFSARMVGLPWIQTVGASTGVIVALASPTSAGEPFNWARVLKHEFVHVITLQQTNFNIPHWFTEALAVTAEGYPRPAVWNELLLERVPKDQLRSLDELNDGFIRPESPLDWQFAYCQSRLYAQYMIEKYGKETIPRMLSAYRENRSTREAIPEVFGVDVATFEEGYRRFLNDIVSQLKQAQPAELDKSPAEIEKAHLADPNDPRAAAEYAYLLFNLTNLEKARELALQALEKNSKEPLAAVVMAQLQLRARDTAAAVHYLEKALDRDKPHAKVLRLLAKLKLAGQRYAEAAELYELGRERFPYDNDWLKGSAAAYLKLQEINKLKQTLAALSQRDPDDPSVRKKLAELALEEHDYKQAAHFGRLTLHIDVLDADVHRILGEAYRGLQDFDRSLQEFEVALQLKPEDAELKLGLARSQAAAGRNRAARSTLQGLLEQQPDNAEAQSLLRDID